MKSYKNLLCLVPVLTLLITMPVGCSSKKDNPTGVVTGSPTETPTNTPTNTPTEAPASTGTEETNAFSYSEGIDENGFWEGVKALDYVENLSYKALSIPKDVYQVSEDSVNTEIDNLMSYNSFEVQTTDRAVADGDTVNIDYVGSVDGVEFAGGSTAGQGTDVTIGVTSYIDDFLEQLIGHMPGETINVEVTFPDVYQEASLQGKDAVFVTTVNYIMTSPELTDEFVETNFYASNGWKTVAEMKENISADLQKNAMQTYIGEYLTNEVTVSSLPDKPVEYQEQAMLQYFRESAEYYGVGFEDFLKNYVGAANENDLIETYRDGNLQSARYTIAAQAVAEEAGISVSDEDMLKYLPDYSSFEERYGMPYLKQNVLYQKVIDYIISLAVLEQ